MSDSINDPFSGDIAGEEWPTGLIDVTGRLIIREFTHDEAEICRQLYIESKSMSDLRPEQMTKEEFTEFHHAYIRYQYGFYGYGNWGIFLKKCEVTALNRYSDCCGPLIGLVGLINGSASATGELSYFIRPEYRRKGFATEACRAALEYGRECGFERFEARISPDNQPSLALAASLGITILPDTGYTQKS